MHCLHYASLVVCFPTRRCQIDCYANLSKLATQHKTANNGAASRPVEESSTTVAVVVKVALPVAACVVDSICVVFEASVVVDVARLVVVFMASVDAVVVVVDVSLLSPIDVVVVALMV